MDCSRHFGHSALYDEDLSRRMSSVLRHKGPRRGVPVQNDGYAEVDTLIRHLRCARSDLEAVVRDSFKRGAARFEMSDDGRFIRATRKHSLHNIGQGSLPGEMNYVLQPASRDSHFRRSTPAGTVASLGSPSHRLFPPPEPPSVSSASAYQPPSASTQVPVRVAGINQQSQPWKPPPPPGPPPDDAVSQRPAADQLALLDAKLEENQRAEQDIIQRKHQLICQRDALLQQKQQPELDEQASNSKNTCGLDCLESNRGRVETSSSSVELSSAPIANAYVLRADFKGSDWGADYLDIKRGVRVAKTSNPEMGWTRVQLLDANETVSKDRSVREGWVPEEFLESVAEDASFQHYRIHSCPASEGSVGSSCRTPPTPP